MIQATVLLGECNFLQFALLQIYILVNFLSYLNEKLMKGSTMQDCKVEMSIFQLFHHDDCIHQNALLNFLLILSAVQIPNFTLDHLHQACTDA